MCCVFWCKNKTEIAAHVCVCKHYSSTHIKGNKKKTHTQYNRFFSLALFRSLIFGCVCVAALGKIELIFFLFILISRYRIFHVHVFVREKKRKNTHAHNEREYVDEELLRCQEPATAFYLRESPLK